jgi:hypothetical protein
MDACILDDEVCRALRSNKRVNVTLPIHPEEMGLGLLGRAWFFFVSRNRFPDSLEQVVSVAPGEWDGVARVTSWPPEVSGLQGEVLSSDQQRKLKEIGTWLQERDPEPGELTMFRVGRMVIRRDSNLEWSKIDLAQSRYTYGLVLVPARITSSSDGGGRVEIG